MITIAIDMDGVLCDFDKAINQGLNKHDPEFYTNLEPMKGAVESFKWLWDRFDVHILSTPPWSNPDGWKGKRLWCGSWLYKGAEKQVTLTTHKDRFTADYLIDDSFGMGYPMDNFKGKKIHFGSPFFPDWESVIEYFRLSYDK